MDRRDFLFYEYSITDVKRNAPIQLEKEVSELGDADLFAPDQDALLERLVRRHTIDVPSLDIGATRTSEEEVDIDLNRDSSARFMRDLDGPHYVKATQITFRVPYKGDSDVFRVKPSSYTMSPIRAEVESDAVIIKVIRPDQNAAEFRKTFDVSVQQIERSLSQLRQDCIGVEQSIRANAKSLIAKRREKRQQDRGLLDQLGFKRAAAK